MGEDHNRRVSELSNFSVTLIFLTLAEPPFFTGIE